MQLSYQTIPVRSLLRQITIIVKHFPACLGLWTYPFPDNPDTLFFLPEFFLERIPILHEFNPGRALAGIVDVHEAAVVIEK